MPTTTTNTTTTRPFKYPIASAPSPTTFGLQSPRGAVLATRFWSSPSLLSTTTPKNNVKGLVLLVHGGGWHSGYFEELASCLTDCGFIVGSYDQVGCGYSDKEPGTPSGLGVGHINSFDDLIEDLFEAVNWLQQEAKETMTNKSKTGQGDVKLDGGDKKLPMFLIGESFGGLQVIEAAFQAEKYNVPIAGVITLGGLLQVHPKFLPPSPVVNVLCFLAQYYPRIVMPATDFESTYDQAFGDPEWAWTTRNDPKIVVSPAPTIGMAAAILGTGDRLRACAKDFPSIPFMAIHGARDVRTSPEAMQRWVDDMKNDSINPIHQTATIHMIDTDGHQLLQDRPEVITKVTDLVSKWIVSTASTTTNGSEN